MNFGLFNEMSNPYFSIIIPTYYSGNILIDCLESIFQQTYTDFEVWIIDGCSNDHTIEIVKTFQKKYQQLNILSEIDAGIYDAMNKGIDLAKGEWLYFMGCDDKFYSTTILSLVKNNIELSKCDVLYGNVYSKRLGEKYDGVFDKFKILNKNICHQSIFFKKSIFEKTGKFNLKYKAYADWNHNFSWLLSPNISNFYLDEIIAFYSDGGFSEVNGDPAFDRDKLINYLLFGKNIFSFVEKIRIIKMASVNALLRKEFKFVFRICYNSIHYF